MQMFVLDQGSRLPLEILDASRIASGGAGTVYRLDSGPYAGSTAKILHDPASFERDKINAMIAQPPATSWMDIHGRKVPQFTWPTHVLEDAQGQGRGFLMPYVDMGKAVPMSTYIELINTLPRADQSITLRMAVARNLAAALVELHKLRHYFVDLKPQNIFVFKETGNVCLLDCDGYAIDGGRFPARQYSSQYLSPEILINNVHPGALSLNDHQDRFAFATLAFQIINYGVHPFQGILADQSIENASTDDFVKGGWYAYGLAANPQVRPCAHSIHAYWDARTRELFDQCFTAPRPSARPRIAEWLEHFDKLLRDKAFSPCEQFPRDILHIHFKGRPCFTCEVLLAPQQFGRAKAPQAPGPESPPTMPSAGSGSTAPCGTPASAGLPKWVHWVIFAIVLAVFAALRAA